MESRTALLIGASGLVGGFCLRALLADSVYAKVISLARRPLPLSHEKLLQQVVDFENVDALSLPSIDDVFCAVGTTIRKAGSQQAFRQVDFALPVAVATSALKSGARQFLLVSSVGADPRSGNFYLRTKGEVEQAVAALPFQAVHIFRPSFLMGPRAEFRLGEIVAIPVAKVLQNAMVGGLRKYRPIQAEDVARAMVAAAKAHRTGMQVYEYTEIKKLQQPL
jgi:uncharacterized protein YbjT (DUF2867 family)